MEGMKHASSEGMMEETEMDALSEASGTRSTHFWSR